MKAPPCTAVIWNFLFQLRLSMDVVISMPVVLVALR
jgi:hypothetical protein